MRSARFFVLGGGLASFAAAAWLGCSSESSPGDAADAGGTDTSIADSTGGDVVAKDTAPPDNEIVNCDNYCARVLANCAGDAAQYVDSPTCLAMCKALPLGSAGDTSGNTIACRMYHAGALAKQAPGFHCLHAGPYGGTVCGTRCGAFCTLAGAQCPAAFADAGSCDASCGTAFDYTPDAAETPQAPTTGDTLNCREYHLEQAFLAPTTQCGNIGRTPAGDAGATFPCR
jgi:hypothetical protein